MINQEMKTIKQYLRSNIKEWIDFSIKICNGLCVISGQPFEVIHHKYPFHKIVDETFKTLNIQYQEDINLYSDEDLELIKNKCLEIHYKYGAGACLTDEIHKELHHIFGNNITIEHFDKFLYYKQNKLNIDELESVFGKKVKEKSRTQIEKTEEEIKLNNIKERQKEELLNNLQFIKSDEFQSNLPLTYKNIKRNIRCLEELLIIAYENIDTSSYYDKDENMIFFTANSYVCRRLNMSINSSTEVSNKLALFTYHKLLNKLEDSEIPNMILKRSQAINANSDKYRKHINCYSIPSYNTLIFNEIEQQGKQWKENNYSMTGISREMFYRGEGLEVANWIYPQHTHVYDKKEKQIVDRTTTNISNARTDEIVKIIFDVLNTQSYVTEKYVINELMSNGDIPTSKKETEKQLKKSLQEILLSYGLKRVRCNKEVKELYNVQAEGYPFILVRE